jgi:hypothetical protein
MLAAGTISRPDLELVTITDSVEEAKRQLQCRAIEQFGLQSATTLRPRWFLGERRFENRNRQPE